VICMLSGLEDRVLGYELCGWVAVFKHFEDIMFIQNITNG